MQRLNNLVQKSKLTEDADRLRRYLEIMHNLIIQWTDILKQEKQE